MKPLMILDDSQAIACRPDAQIWANANAGTGKTTVLTSRVLRLLLAGTKPSKILCLTYTKVAASEVQNRIIDRLRHWVTLDEQQLTSEILTLTNTPPTDATLKRARGLFIDVLESAEGMNIHTIHAFAQSLLRKFPIEAGVSPYFQIIDEQESASLAERAMRLTIQQLASGKLPHITEHAAWLMKEASDQSLRNLLKNALQDLLKWNDLKYHSGGIQYFKQVLAEVYNIPPTLTEAELNHTFFALSEAQMPQVQIAIAWLAEKSNAPDYMVKLQTALQLRLDNVLNIPDNIERYVRAFLTTTNTPRKNIEKLANSEPSLSFLNKEFTHLKNYVESKATLYSYQKTVSYYALMDVLLEYHQKLSARLGVLDYQQLLIKASALLTSSSNQSSWVMFKLDGGLEHILVDEAQDTSPEQWEIIQALTNEFFVGESKSDVIRTLFIVGDEKQSIFSFQGADVREFNRMKAWFEERASFSNQPLNKVLLSKSYRSAHRIIHAVNVVAEKIGFESTHEARADAGQGRVVMWPVVDYKQFVRSDSQDDSIYETAEDVDDSEATTSVQVSLGRKIAQVICHWLAQGKVIEAENRAIKPEDIMILVRRRSALVDTITRQLKKNNIPVQGIDRMVLNEQLVVQDLLAFGRWLTLPEDDYALACILRSPIFGISEEDLFTLAHNRKDTLWGVCQHLSSQHDKFQAIYIFLKPYLAKVDYDDPYTLFYNLLMKDKVMQKFKQRMGIEAVAIIEEFLNQAKIYQTKYPASMQGFIHAMEQSDLEVKRTNVLQDAVRIMTVHGAKGLEAPIVIMADSADAKRPHHDILWVEFDGITLPLCIPSKAERSEFLHHFAEAAREREIAEYHRQLYVAMTRAKNELYISGYRTKNSDFDESWYALLENALKDVAEYSEEIGSETQHFAPVNPLNIKATSYSFPDFVTTTNIPLRNSNNVWRASNLSVPSFVNASQRVDYNAQEFGILMHECIRRLFYSASDDISQIDIERAIGSIRANYSPEMLTKLGAALTDLVYYSETAFLFKYSDRLVETPMVGTIEILGNNQTISAQIDLCVFRDNIAWLVDFKTSDNVPVSIHDIPKAYLRQMALYRHFVASIFPTKQVRTALVWTAIAKLQEIPDHVLTSELLDVMQGKA
jgi:ATP-dependent helicase/nuclease subunit A